MRTKQIESSRLQPLKAGSGPSSPYSTLPFDLPLSLARAIFPILPHIVPLPNMIQLFFFLLFFSSFLWAWFLNSLDFTISLSTFLVFIMSTAQDAADRSVITSSNDTSSAVYQPSSNYTVSNQNNTDSQNSTFIVRQSNGATYISPRIVDPSWVELKIGVLLPFHQQGNYWTKELTLR